MSFKLRDYQQQAVDATIRHFRKSNDAAVIVLPTGAGKSLVIAELARLARQRILVLTHVKELVEQNHDKYQQLGASQKKQAGIFSAGLKQKNSQHQVTFASIQSAARNLEHFDHEYSLVIIDECHRINNLSSNDFSQGNDSAAENSSQYAQIIQHLKNKNPALKVFGLTATPYRLGMGWIYEKHHRGFARSTEPRPFKTCIYELPLRLLIKRGYLTEPRLIDAPIAQYDFSGLQSNAFGDYNQQEVNQLLVDNERVTKSIIDQVQQLAEQRQGIMIFASTVDHAKEVYGYLPADQSALITGATDNQQRDELINAFKQKRIKYLVNVSVLTTGFDAPHVDFIAILRPTQSASLYQQIVGRGLRLSAYKKDCLIIDYAGSGFDLYAPEVGEKKPNPQAQQVQVLCPGCGFANIFWGIKDEQGKIIEHYGRRCQGLLEQDNDFGTEQQQCDYRFVFKECGHCGGENDIAARQCQHCRETLVDPDDILKKALQLKDARVIRCSGISLHDNKGKLKVIYHDEQGEELSEQFDLNNPMQRQVFNQLFMERIKRKLLLPAAPYIETVGQALQLCAGFPAPDFVIARKQKHYWKIQERVFDYSGKFRKANAL